MLVLSVKSAMGRLADYQNASGDQLVGLEGVSEYGKAGKVGKIVGYDKRQGYALEFKDGTRISLKPSYVFTAKGIKELDGALLLPYLPFSTFL